MALTFAGCAGPSPRFAGGSAGVPGEDESLHAERIGEELRREDDRPLSNDSLRTLLVPGDSSAAAASRRDRLLGEVVSYLGVPYRYGGSTRRGFDCSGFVSAVFSDGAGIALPRSAREQYRQGVEIPRSDLRFGDLVFFNTTGAVPSHVGIFLEGEVFAHASVRDGVTFSSLESSYYRNRFVGARRLLDD